MTNPKSTAQIAGHPLHPMVIPFPIAFYIGTFAADAVYAATSDPFWARAAFWLLALGIATSVFAGFLGLVDFLNEKAIRAVPAAWWHAGGNGLVSAISILDLCLRVASGAVTGSHAYIWLSLIVALLICFTSWMGGQLVFKHRVGVSEAPAIKGRTARK